MDRFFEDLKQGWAAWRGENGDDAAWWLCEQVYQGTPSFSRILWEVFEYPCIVEPVWYPYPQIGEHPWILPFDPNSPEEIADGYARGAWILKNYVGKQNHPLTTQYRPSVDDAIFGRAPGIVFCTAVSDFNLEKFLTLYSEYALRHWVGLRCWHLIYRKVLRWKLDGLLFDAGLGSEFSQVKYKELLLVAGRALGIQTPKGIDDKRDECDAAETGEIAQDWIADAISKIKSTSEADLARKALGGAFGEGRLKGRFINQLKLKRTKGRNDTDVYKDGEFVEDATGKDGKKYQKINIIEIVETMFTVSDFSLNQSTRGAQPGLSCRGRENARRVGRLAPEIIDRILTDDAARKKNGYLHQKKIADDLGCSENTVTNVLKKLKAMAQEYPDPQEWVVEFLDISLE